MNTTKYICLIAIFASCVDLHSALNWKVQPTCEFPPARGGHRMTNIDNEIIVMWGGYWECFEPNTQNCDHIYFEDLWHYDLDKEKWISVNATGVKPRPRTFPGFNTWEKDDGSVAVLFAGARYNAPFSTFENYGDIWFYDAYDKIWTEVHAINEGPGARVGPSVAIYKNDMYVFGGVAGNFSVGLPVKGDLWKFNLIHKNWTLLIPDGQPGNPQGAYLGSFRLDKDRKQIVLFSGAVQQAGAGILTNTTWLYSIVNNNWTQVSNTIPSRVHGSAEVIDDKFIVAFGDGQVVINGTDQCITSTISSGHKPINEFWALDLVSLAWEKLNVSCSEAKKRTTSTRVGKKIFDWGGFNYQCPFGPPGFPMWDRELRSLRV